MNYCSLEDAFNMAPGCNQTDSSAKEARREERRRAKKCKGPALTFLESKDPDRQQLERPKEIPAMSSMSTGLKGHVPADAPLGMEPFQDVNVIGSDGGMQEEILRQNMASFFPRTDDDPAGDKQRSTLPTPAMLAQALPSKSPAKKSFFGADPGDDSFADYMPDAKNYLMEPSFTTAFKSLNPGTMSKSVLPVPSVRDTWKPLTPTGVDTAFFSKLPPPGGEYTPSDGYPYAPSRGEANRGGNADDYMSYKSMYRKMDTILARLDELQRGPNPEQSQKEILLFVSSGIFVLFMMDLLVRKGSSLRFLRGL